MSTLRIFYIVNSDWFFLSHRLPLALEAKRRGYDVYILSKDTGKRVEIESYGLKFINVDFERSGTNPVKDLRVIFELIRLYRAYKPNIVHHVTIKPALYGTIAVKFLKTKKISVVNAISGLGYNFINNRKSFTQLVVKKLMDMAFSSQSGFFIFQNPDDMLLYRELGYINNKNAVLIKGAGVDSTEFPYTSPIKKNVLEVMFSARMLYDKGVIEYIEAAKKLQPVLAGKVLFRLVGGIDNHNPAGVPESILKELLIPDYIVWEGYKQDMLHECIQADIVCLPSYREGLPKALVEAMAIGRPVVTTDVPGCRECVENGYNGFLVPVRNVEQLAQALQKLCMDEQMRLEMGKASRQKMMKELSLETVLRETFDFYDKVLYRKPRQRQLSEAMSILKISVITVLLDSQTHIKDAINSILSQDYPNIEYIVIDGGSKDGSLDIIQSYGNKIHRVVSEPDEGIYDALNKGLALATGDVIGFLHSDDFYVHNQVIQTVAAAFDDNTDAVYGDLDYVSLTDKHKVVRQWRSGKYKPALFYKGWMPPHPTFFVCKSIYTKYGGYDTRLKSAADYELMLRLLLKHKIKVKYIPEVLVKMRVGGQSNRLLSNRIRANLEDRKAWKLNGLKPGFFTLLLKPLRKIFQYKL